MSLADDYKEKFIPKLLKELKLKNTMQVPRIEKIVVNVGLGEALKDRKALGNMSEVLAIITGQKPAVCKAKVAISSFKLRIGDKIGLKVTLRGRKKYDFLEKLIKIVLPRIRDFQGLDPDAFDGRGNYSLGISEQIVFPEVDYSKIDKVRGLQITIVTTAKDDKAAKCLLYTLGFPFKREK